MPWDYLDLSVCVCVVVVVVATVVVVVSSLSCVDERCYSDHDFEVTLNLLCLSCPNK